MTILTDPPTVVVRPKKSSPFFGGSYQGIPGIRKRLVEEGHSVTTFVVYDSQNLSLENALYDEALRSQELIAPQMQKGVPLWDAIRQSRPHAVVLVVKSEKLAEIEPLLFNDKRISGLNLAFFVSTGKIMRQRLVNTVKTKTVRIWIVDKPGVARMTKRGLYEIMATLRELSESNPNNESANHL